MRKPEFRGGECGMNGKPQKLVAEGKFPAVGRLREVVGCYIHRRKGWRKADTRRRRKGADEEEEMGKMRRAGVAGGIRQILPRHGGCGGGGGCGAQMGTPFSGLMKSDQIRSNQIKEKQDQKSLILINVMIRWETWGLVNGEFIYGGVELVNDVYWNLGR